MGLSVRPPPPIDPTSGVPPPAFLSDLARDAVFNTHIAIGIPENEVLPTLSLEDYFKFCEPITGSDGVTKNTLNWQSIEKNLYDKYSLRSLRDPKDVTASLFVTKLKKHFGNGDSKDKSVLLVPGRWSNFSLPDALDLAKIILEQSNFLVYILNKAHPLSTPDNAHELNPLICGNAHAKII